MMPTLHGGGQKRAGRKGGKWEKNVQLGKNNKEKIATLK